MTVRESCLREGFDNGVQAAAERIETLAFMPKNRDRKAQLLGLAADVRTLKGGK
jgi:hypothetical protein